MNASERTGEEIAEVTLTPWAGPLGQLGKHLFILMRFFNLSFNNKIVRITSFQSILGSIWLDCGCEKTVVSCKKSCCVL
jgi:hypothetical protein